MVVDEPSDSNCESSHVTFYHLCLFDDHKVNNDQQYCPNAEDLLRQPDTTGSCANVGPSQRPVLFNSVSSIPVYAYVYA